MKILIGFRIADCYFDKHVEIPEGRATERKAKQELDLFIEDTMRGYLICDQCHKLTSRERIFTSKDENLCDECLTVKMWG